MSIILAIIIGGLFGFVLDRVGATNPNNIINMLRLTDTRLMRIILGAIGIASIGLFAGIEFGLIDIAHLSVKESYVGVVVGGILLCIGFAISGYCPGTGMTALATGRKDAAVFILGGLIGAFLFMLSYEFLKGTFLFEEISSGKVTLGSIEGSSYEGMINANGSTIGIVPGLVLLFIAIVLPEKLRK
ncbi:MAG: hypothetical protein ACI9TY_000577 [Alphaproteobacteria bacterium]|jgi:hypothetical protein